MDFFVKATFLAIVLLFSTLGCRDDGDDDDSSYSRSGDSTYSNESGMGACMELIAMQVVGSVDIQGEKYNQYSCCIMEEEDCGVTGTMMAFLEGKEIEYCEDEGFTDCIAGCCFKTEYF